MKKLLIVILCFLSVNVFGQSEIGDSTDRELYEYHMGTYSTYTPTIKDQFLLKKLDRLLDNEFDFFNTWDSIDVSKKETITYEWYSWTELETLEYNFIESYKIYEILEKAIVKYNDESTRINWFIQNLLHKYKRNYILLAATEGNTWDVYVFDIKIKSPNWSNVRKTYKEIPIRIHNTSTSNVVVKNRQISLSNWLSWMIRPIHWGLYPMIPWYTEDTILADMSSMAIWDIYVYESETWVLDWVMWLDREDEYVYIKEYRDNDGFYKVWETWEMNWPRRIVAVHDTYIVKAYGSRWRAHRFEATLVDIK